MYEVFVYIGELNRLHGNYLKVVHMESLPSIGADAGNGYKVIDVSGFLGIIDVVLDKK